MSFWMERHEVDALMPPAFINLCYSDVRVILNATEIAIEKPSHPQIQRCTWSEYEHGNTLKGLIGISPIGCVTLVSRLYGGCISDTELTLCCTTLYHHTINNTNNIRISLLQYLQVPQLLNTRGSSNTTPLLPVLSNIPLSVPWSQLQFSLHSGMYFNSCAYDTSFHCIGAIRSS